LADGLPILADIARRPSFSEAELRRVRRETLDGLSLSMQDPDQLTDFAVAPLVFGKGPYGHAMGGLPRSLARITRADIVRQHARLYRPDNAILILTGDVDPETGFALAERAFGDWAKPAGAPPLAAVNGPAPRGRTIVINLPGADEATVTVAGRSIGRLDPAYYAVEVANSMLGGGYSSRLNTEIRIKRGLSYDAGSQVDERYRTGLFSATAQTDNASAPEVAGLMLAQLLTLGATAPPADELAARKAALIGEFGRDAETSADMADLLADDAVYGVPLEELARYPQRIEAVTSAEAQAAAGRLADAPRTDVLIVGDARRFLPALRRRFAKIQVVSAGKLKLDSPSLR
jgi:zinc protease